MMKLELISCQASSDATAQLWDFKNSTWFIHWPSSCWLAAFLVKNEINSNNFFPYWKKIPVLLDSSASFLLLSETDLELAVTGQQALFVRSFLDATWKEHMRKSRIRKKEDFVLSIFNSSTSQPNLDSESETWSIH